MDKYINLKHEFKINVILSMMVEEAPPSTPKVPV